MRLFLYYGLHSIKNQIKKLFKTWMVVFILACFVFGGLFGGLIGLGTAMFEDGTENATETETVSEMIADRDGIDESEDDESFSEYLEETDTDFLLGPWIPIMGTADWVELIAGAGGLFLFVLMAFFADKSGSKLFLPADVNILFASPLKPQSVLLFRLTTQLGAMLIMTVYMLFQLPNLMLNVGIGFWSGLAIIFAWTLAMMLGSLIQLFLYMVGATCPQHKNKLRMGLYGFIILVAGGFGLWWRGSGMPLIPGLVEFFTNRFSRLIPFWGWLKGFCYHAVMEEPLQALAYLGALFLGIALLMWLLWRFKADFYEDAMYKAEELAELQAAVQSDKTGAVVLRRKKDRSEKIKRDGFEKGWGANVFFYKALYNRRRFGYLGYFTKTTVFYLIAVVFECLFCKQMLGIEGMNLVPVGIMLGVFVFFRSLGNPLQEDTKMDFFRMLPESSWMKMFWSLLGGTVNSLMDLLPAVIAGALLLGENPLLALAWIPFLLSLDFYATNVGVFIDLSVPVSAGKTIKQLIQILFIYFGLLPDVAALVLCGIFVNMTVGIVLAALLNFGFGFLFFAFSPMFLEPGRGK